MLDRQAGPARSVLQHPLAMVELPAVTIQVVRPEDGPPGWLPANSWWWTSSLCARSVVSGPTTTHKIVKSDTRLPSPRSYHSFEDLQWADTEEPVAYIPSIITSSRSETPCGVVSTC
jgi:hypothetical protein